jgi:AcrR family transcriptional regulator
MKAPASVENRRVARTRRRVEATLLVLLAERGYERTSVRALVARADVGKSTFYEHYRDKDAVLTSALATLGRELEVNDGRAPPFAFLEPLLAHVSAHRALAARLRTSSAGGVVLDRFHALVRARIAEELSRRFPKVAEDRVALASEHATGGLFGLVEARLRRGSLDAGAIANAWRELVLPGLSAWLGTLGSVS